MKKEQILEELEKVLNRMEGLEGECKAGLKGYADGAAELAVQAIAHTIDLVSVSHPMEATCKQSLRVADEECERAPNTSETNER